MTGFEPRSSDIGSDRSANCATTTAQYGMMFMHLFNSTGLANFNYFKKNF